MTTTKLEPLGALERQAMQHRASVSNGVTPEYAEGASDALVAFNARILRPYVDAVEELCAAVKETHGLTDDDPDKLMRVDKALARLEAAR